MATQIITIEDLQQFRLQLLEDLKVLIQPANNPSQKEWLKSTMARTSSPTDWVFVFSRPTN